MVPALFRDWLLDVARETIVIDLKNILVATDFSPVAEKALRYGRELATRYGATLHVLHVADDVSARLLGATGLPYDTTLLQRDLEAAGVEQLETLVTDEDRRDLHARLVQAVSASPAQQIVEYAAMAHIDLIVLGTHGRGGMAHFMMGSVAERVVRTAFCPVLTVHDREREFIRPEGH
jgi:nucleotide-binding universal stress UspA family protein